MRAPLLATVLLLVPLAVTAGGTRRVPPGMVRVEAGSFRPLYTQPGERIAKIGAFAIDTVPVSQADFLSFVARNPQWSRERVPALFADRNYLSGVLANARRPITRVSWFAAMAYCRSRGARLPTTNEWEYAAAASETRRNASEDPSFKQRVLELAMRARPSEFLLGTGFRNVYGVRDLHGGITEWTSDFHTIFGDDDSRTTGYQERSTTCAAGVAQTSGVSDYAAFLRYSFRATSDARSTGTNVGFRCAAS